MEKQRGAPSSPARWDAESFPELPRAKSSTLMAKFTWLRIQTSRTLAAYSLLAVSHGLAEDVGYPVEFMAALLTLRKTSEENGRLRSTSASARAWHRRRAAECAKSAGGRSV